jgi:hypothetical protein
VQPVHRFLALVARELGAEDARVELGGHPDPGAIWAPLEGDFRVVALFGTPPADADAKREQLAALAASFSGLVAGVALPQGKDDREPIARTLEDTLDLLVHRARAESAWVIDESSPEIWGSSEPGRPALDVDDAIFLSKLEAQLTAVGIALDGSDASDPSLVRARALEGGLSGEATTALLRDVERLEAFPPGTRETRSLRAMRSLARARAGEADPSSLVRTFATIYRVVLVFANGMSELHAESALIRALPVIERLVTSLPPRKPTGSGPETAGAKVAVLRRLRSV